MVVTIKHSDELTLVHNNSILICEHDDADCCNFQPLKITYVAVKRGMELVWLDRVLSLYRYFVYYSIKYILVSNMTTIDVQIKQNI